MSIVTNVATHTGCTIRSLCVYSYNIYIHKVWLYNNDNNLQQCPLFAIDMTPYSCASMGGGGG